MEMTFGGRVLLLGCGSVSQCLQPLLLRHVRMDFTKLTVMDYVDNRHRIADTLAAGAAYVQTQLTPDNMAETLGQYLGNGDLLIDLAWNIDAGDIIQWCHDHNVLYINTSVEKWDPYYDLENTHPTERTLYVRHMALRRRVAAWTEPGPTAVVEHGANPGLVSHWAKVALTDITRALLAQTPARETALAPLLDARDWPRLAHALNVQVIHISERDTQIPNKPKEPDEFVNTWSVEGLYEEGIAPAELGWGTHERVLPEGAFTHLSGPGNQICLNSMGINTWVRSWVPMGGQILGMVVRHGEAFTMSDYLTVRADGGDVLYRPTVHYAYMPADVALTSLHEVRMRSYDMQERQRILNDEITDGRDELGVLLMGHDLNGWWTGSQLDIHEARRLVPGQNATTLQVAASILGALAWMFANPREGVRVPDELPHEPILAAANPYLGPSVSVQTDWNPLAARFEAFDRFGKPRPREEDKWQFSSFLFSRA